MYIYAAFLHRECLDNSSTILREIKFSMRSYRPFPFYRVMNQMEFFFIHKKNQYDHIPFNLEGNKNLVLLPYQNSKNSNSLTPFHGYFDEATKL